MKDQEVLAGVIEKLDAIIVLCAPQRQNWLKNLKEQYPDLTALKLELIGKEAAISGAIDAICQEWVNSGKLPTLPKEDALKYIPFVWDRFSRALLFARWMYDGGCRIHDRTEQAVLTWLLNDSWRQYSRMVWRESSAGSL